MRGVVLDNRYNGRREGLPISADTSIPPQNKERIEILKGRAASRPTGNQRVRPRGSLAWIWRSVSASAGPAPPRLWRDRVRTDGSQEPPDGDRDQGEAHRGRTPA